MIVALLGPHAVGKSTALQRWVERYGHIGLKGIHCDNNRLIEGNAEHQGVVVETTQKGWSGTGDDKVRLARECHKSPNVYVLEGNTARSIPWLKVVPVKQIIHVTATPQRFGELMKERCEKKNKPYRSDYWNHNKLLYESHGRLRNALHANAIRAPFQEFKINDQMIDWDLVDTFFYALFRKLNNERVRSA